MLKLEQSFAKSIRRTHKAIYKGIKRNVIKEIEKAQKLQEAITDDKKTPKALEALLFTVYQHFDTAQDELLPLFYKNYDKSSLLARENVGKQLGILVTTNFISSDVQRYFTNQAAGRVKNITETTMGLLRDELYQAYTNKETVAQWQARIEKVVDCIIPIKVLLPFAPDP